MRGDPDVDALPCKQVSRSASEPLLLSLVNHKIHVLSVSTCAKLKRSVQLDLGHRKHGGTEKGGVISPLLSNISLHWFETCAMMVAKATNQVMSIVRYADDFVILAREWADGFVQRIENELENRFGLVVKRGKKRILDMKADRSALSFLGYEFRCTISSVASTSFELVLRSRRRMDVQ